MRRALAKRSSSTVVLTLVRAMPGLCHRCGTTQRNHHVHVRVPDRLASRNPVVQADREPVRSQTCDQVAADLSYQPPTSSCSAVPREKKSGWCRDGTTSMWPRLRGKRSVKATAEAMRRSTVPVTMRWQNGQSIGGSMAHSSWTPPTGDSVALVEAACGTHSANRPPRTVYASGPVRRQRALHRQGTPQRVPYSVELPERVLLDRVLPLDLRSPFVLGLPGYLFRARDDVLNASAARRYRAAPIGWSPPPTWSSPRFT